MIIIMSDINKQTYIPGIWVASPCLLFYKRKHPKTLGYVSAYVRQTSIIFSYNMHHTFLTFALVFSSFCFAFHFAEIHNSIVDSAYPNSIAIPCANLICFMP